MFTNEDAANALAELGLDLTSEGFGLDDLRRGMDVELEHGTRFADLNVTEDDPVVTAKIAVAHLREFSDYYDRLDAMEREADAARAAQLDEAGGII